MIASENPALYGRGEKGTLRAKPCLATASTYKREPKRFSLPRKHIKAIFIELSKGEMAHLKQASEFMKVNHVVLSLGAWKIQK